MLDTIAKDLTTGALQRQDTKGNPVKPVHLPSDQY